MIEKRFCNQQISSKIKCPFLVVLALMFLILPIQSQANESDHVPSFVKTINDHLYEGWYLENVSARIRFAERTILGDDAPEKFRAWDVAANFRMPKTFADWDDWHLGTNFMASAGLIRGADQYALTLSGVPELMLRSKDGKYTLNAGIGIAAFTRNRYGVQDFGGPFQFALTYGATVELSRHIRLGYRFQHYSDAGLNGPDTTGADLHMVEVYYQF